MERKLAAILAADVVGYSSLMEIDEAGTHERLKAGRQELFEPEIARHHGRVFKVMGDGMLAEFGSVVDAVECAVALQRGLGERNAAATKEQRIELRIGINLGEVIVEGDDRYGEGVNIATRLQQLAVPGGVYVSEKVAKEVEKKLAFGFERLGRQKMKNITEPVSVFCINLNIKPRRAIDRIPMRHRWAVMATIAAILILGGGAWLLYYTQLNGTAVPLASAVVDARPSLVVLPFDNLSDDKEQGYLADGITEDLTTALARIPGLFVVSRNAAFAYRGKSTNPVQIAKELGVRYIIEGSTRRAGEEMRINAQLIDALTGGHVWAERFDGPWSDVFVLQDRVVGEVASALELRLVTGKGKADIAGGTSNPAAYEVFLRGLELELRNTPAAIAKAVPLYEHALALDPDFGRAAAQLAWIYWNMDSARAQAVGVSWEELEARLAEFLDRAAEHPSPTYYQVVAELLVRRHNSDEAIVILQKAVALDPSDPWTFEGLSSALIFNGQPKEGLAYLETAKRLDPAGLNGAADWRQFLAGLAAFGDGRFEDAIRLLEGIDVSAPSPWPEFFGFQVLISAYGHLERSAELASTKAELKRLLIESDEGDYDRLFAQHFFVFKNEADILRLLDGLRKAGVPEFSGDHDLDPGNRLTSAEIQSLVFGHELQGRRTAPDTSEYRRVTTPDGSATVTIGSQTFRGQGWTQADTHCTAFDDLNLTQCGVIFRNPVGTRSQQNDYLFIFHQPRFQFSVVN